MNRFVIERTTVWREAIGTRYVVDNLLTSTFVYRASDGMLLRTFHRPQSGANQLSAISPNGQLVAISDLILCPCHSSKLWANVGANYRQSHTVCHIPRETRA